jgi:hypothetical protein
MDTDQPTEAPADDARADEPPALVFVLLTEDGDALGPRGRVMHLPDTEAAIAGLATS